MSGEKLTRVRNEHSLVRKKFAKSKLKDDGKEDEERSVADTMVVEA